MAVGLLEVLQMSLFLITLFLICMRGCVVFVKTGKTHRNIQQL